MIGIYFSGTGNSKYCVEKFLQECDSEAKAFSIEEEGAVMKIWEQEELVIGYPVQYSNIPKILRDFILGNKSIWQGKKVFVIATMGLFSGDGAGILGRLLEDCGANITGGLHLKMPDNICDEKPLKKTFDNNKKLIKNAELKIAKAALSFKKGNPTKEGLGLFYHAAGLFGQRLYFYNKTKAYSDKLKIDINKCTGCGKCIALCPMKNIHMRDGKAVPEDKCTMCYRCVNRCPVQAITLLGKRVISQSYIEKYL